MEIINSYKEYNQKTAKDYYNLFNKNLKQADDLGNKLDKIGLQDMSFVGKAAACLLSLVGVHNYRKYASIEELAAEFEKSLNNFQTLSTRVANEADKYRPLIEGYESLITSLENRLSDYTPQRKPKLTEDEILQRQKSISRDLQNTKDSVSRMKKEQEEYRKLSSLINTSQDELIKKYCKIDSFISEPIYSGESEKTCVLNNR